MGIPRPSPFGPRAPARALSAALLAAVYTASACESPPPPVDTGPVVPGETWSTIAEGDLEAYGWDATMLDAATAFLTDSSNTTALVVAENGRVAYTYGDITHVSYLASVRKSILAMLYGV